MIINMKNLTALIFIATICGCNSNNYHKRVQSNNFYPSQQNKPNYVRLGSLAEKKSMFINPVNQNPNFAKSNNSVKGKYIGNLNSNPYDPNSISNPYGKHGSKYSTDSINNPYGKYGSKYSNQSVNNPYATNTPKLYDSSGKYMGKISSNKYDPESISNPYGKYGNKYSPDSVNNPYGAGNPYKPNSPTNSFGTGFKIKSYSPQKPNFYNNSNSNNFYSPSRPSFYGNSNNNNFYSPNR